MKLSEASKSQHLMPCRYIVKKSDKIKVTSYQKQHILTTEKSHEEYCNWLWTSFWSAKLLFYNQHYKVLKIVLLTIRQYMNVKIQQNNKIKSKSSNLKRLPCNFLLCNFPMHTWNAYMGIAYTVTEGIRKKIRGGGGVASMHPMLMIN